MHLLQVMLNAKTAMHQFNTASALACSMPCQGAELQGTSAGVLSAAAATLWQLRSGHCPLRKLAAHACDRCAAPAAGLEELRASRSSWASGSASLALPAVLRLLLPERGARPKLSGGSPCHALRGAAATGPLLVKLPLLRDWASPFSVACCCWCDGRVKPGGGSDVDTLRARGWEAELLGWIEVWLAASESRGSRSWLLSGEPAALPCSLLPASGAA